MSFAISFPLFFLLLGVPTLTTQVDVQLTGLWGWGSEMWCSNLRPGECCKMRDPDLPSLNNAFDVINFYHLDILDVGAVWSEALYSLSPSNGCSGPAIDAHIGLSGSTWTFSSDDYSPEAFPTGAMYFRLPRSQEPSQKDKSMLGTEGIGALVRGGHKWSSHKVGISLSGSFPRKRAIISQDTGIAFLNGPPRWRYPDLISANGTNYTDDSRGDLVYRSENGAVLDLNDLAN